MLLKCHLLPGCLAGSGHIGIESWYSKGSSEGRKKPRVPKKHTGGPEKPGVGRGQAVDPQRRLDTGKRACPQQRRAHSEIRQPRQAAYTSACMCKLKKTQMIQRNLFTKETRTETRRKQTHCYQKGTGWEREISSLELVCINCDI